MSLGAPLWLALWSSGLLVLVLHTLRRRRPRVVGSLLLWQRVAAGVPPPPAFSRRLLLNLPLLLQLLVVFLVGLALARPVLGGREPYPEHLVFVLDASGSMQARDLTPSRFEAARRYAAREAGRQPPGAPRPPRLSLVVAAPRAYLAAARLADRGAFQAALQEVEGTHGRADWEGVARLLAALRSKGTGGGERDERVEVRVLTDGSDPVNPAALLAAALPGATIRPIAFSTPGAANVGLTRFAARPETGTPAAAGRWRVEGEVWNAGSAPCSVPIGLFFTPHGAPGDGGRDPGQERELATTRVTVPPRQSARFRFDVALPGPGVLAVRLPPDTLPQDDSAYWVTGRPVRILYLGPAGSPVERALQAVGGVELYRAEELPRESASFDLVVVDGRPVARHPGVSTWWLGVEPPAGVAAGGGGDGPADGPAWLTDPSPTGWQGDHPLSDGVRWADVTVRRARSMRALPAAEVLLEAGGHPLVQARTTPTGREVVTAFTLEDTDWAGDPGFPTFVANLVDWVGGGRPGPAGGAGAVGDPFPLDPRLAAGDGRLWGPDGRPVAGVDPPVLFRLFGEGVFRPLRAGLYAWQAGGVQAQFAVNALDPLESDIRPRHGFPRGDPADGPEPGRFALSRWLAGAALGLLLLEAALARRAGHEPGSSPAAGGGRRARRLARALHGIAALLLLLAVLDVPVYRRQHPPRVVFVVDDAVSTPAARDRIGAFLARAERAAGRNSAAGVVRLDPADPEAGLALAAGLLPPGTPGRVVLISDGTATPRAGAPAVARLVARGIPVDTFVVGAIPQGEVWVETLEGPSRLHPHTPFWLEALVASAGHSPATVQLFREGRFLAERRVQLLPGRNRIRIGATEDQEGTFLYTVHVRAPGDAVPENNTGGWPVHVEPPPRILILTPDPARAARLVDALAVQGLPARVASPAAAPGALAGWLQLDAVLLLDVPAGDLPADRQALLERWIREYGGGLIVAGGSSSFGPGGYHLSTLERVLPLSSRIPGQAPRLNILFVLDKSGSMQQLEGSVPRLEIARQAVSRAVRLLHPDSRVGLVAFDSEADVLVPLQAAGDREQLESRLRQLAAGGGTAIYPALVQAYRVLAGAPAEERRHVVLVSDGLSQAGDFDGILARLAGAGITVSTVAIGEGADVERLRAIAQRGGGVAHVTTDWQALPSIMAEEILRQGGSAVVEEPVRPARGPDEAPFLAGLPRDLPALHGYVRTTAKPAARIHLEGPGATPLLASWQYGLGRVVALPWEAAGPWSAEWLAIPEYPRFWAQMVRWTLSRAPGPGWQVWARAQGPEIRVVARGTRPDGAPAAGLELQAWLRPAVPQASRPGGSGEARPENSGPAPVLPPVPLRETRPGRYEGRFRQPVAPGLYQVDVQGIAAASQSKGGGGAGGSAGDDPAGVSAFLYVPYPYRLALQPGAPGELAALARATGGQALTGDGPPGPPALGRPAPRGTLQAGWPVWTVLGLFFFLGALVVRYGLPGATILRHPPSPALERIQPPPAPSPRTP